MGSGNRMARGIAGGAGAIAIALWLAGAGAGQRAADPVTALRQLLKTTDQSAAERDRALKQAVAALPTLDDLRQALTLPEWTYEDWDTSRAGVDQANLAGAAKRFEELVRAELRGSDKPRQLALLAMLGEMNAAPSHVLGRTGLGHDLSTDVAALIRQGRPQVCEAAAETLGRIDPDPAVAAGVLGDALRSPQAPPRLAAARGLSHLMGSALQHAGQVRGSRTEAGRKDLVAVANAAVSVAGRGVGDPQPEVRRLCVEILAQAAAALCELADNPRFRGADAETSEGGPQFQQEWEQMRPLALALKEQAEALPRVLHDPDVQVRLGAGQALEALAVSRNRLLQRAAGAGVTLAGPAAAERREEPGPRRIHLAAFRILPPASNDPLLIGLRATLPALTVEVYDPDARVRLKAIEVLESMGPPALPAAPVLVRALEDPDRFVRWAAARTLGKLGPVEPVEAVRALELLLGDADLDVRRAAALTLEGYRDAAKPALGGLIRTLRGPDPLLKTTVLRTLKSMGTAAEPAVPALRATLADPDARVRQLAGEVLTRLEAPHPARGR